MSGFLLLFACFFILKTQGNKFLIDRDLIAQEDGFRFNFRKGEGEVRSTSFQSIGCWKDTWNRAIVPLEGKHKLLMDVNYKLREDPLRKCAVAALEKRLQVFALENGGQCFGDTSAASFYRNFGRAYQCKDDGYGGPWSMQVYRFTGFDVKPRDGGYTKWSQWTTCSKTCGRGIKTRSRTCTNPRPTHGGSSCRGLGRATEKRSCGEPCEGEETGSFASAQPRLSPITETSLAPKVSSFTKTPEKSSNDEENEDDDKSEKDDYDYNDDDDDYHDDDDDDEIKNIAGETKGNTAKGLDSVTSDTDNTPKSDANARNDNDVKPKEWSNEVKAAKDILRAKWQSLKPAVLSKSPNHVQQGSSREHVTTTPLNDDEGTDDYDEEVTNGLPEHKYTMPDQQGISQENASKRIIEQCVCPAIKCLNLAMDTGVLIDNSNVTDIEDLAEMKAFAKGLAAGFIPPVLPQNIQMGVIAGGMRSRIVVPFHEKIPMQEFNRRVDGIRREEGPSDMGRAFKRAEAYLLLKQKKAIPPILNDMVFVMESGDGDADIHAPLKDLKSAGAKIVMIGVGKNAKLGKAASQADKSFMVPPGAGNAIVNAIIAAVCKPDLMGKMIPNPIPCCTPAKTSKRTTTANKEPTSTLASLSNSDQNIGVIHDETDAITSQPGNTPQQDVTSQPGITSQSEPTSQSQPGIAPETGNTSQQDTMSQPDNTSESGTTSQPGITSEPENASPHVYTQDVTGNQTTDQRSTAESNTQSSSTQVEAENKISQEQPLNNGPGLSPSNDTPSQSSNQTSSSALSTEASSLNVNVPSLSNNNILTSQTQTSKTTEPLTQPEIKGTQTEGGDSGIPKDSSGSTQSTVEADSTNITQSQESTGPINDDKQASALKGNINLPNSQTETTQDSDGTVEPNTRGMNDAPVDKEVSSNTQRDSTSGTDTNTSTSKLSEPENDENPEEDEDYDDDYEDREVTSDDSSGMVPSTDDNGTPKEDHIPPQSNSEDGNPEEDHVAEVGSFKDGNREEDHAAPIGSSEDGTPEEDHIEPAGSPENGTPTDDHVAPESSSLPNTDEHQNDRQELTVAPGESQPSEESDTSPQNVEPSENGIGDSDSLTPSRSPPPPSLSSDTSNDEADIPDDTYTPTPGNGPPAPEESRNQQDQNVPPITQDGATSTDSTDSPVTSLQNQSPSVSETTDAPPQSQDSSTPPSQSQDSSDAPSQSQDSSTPPSDDTTTIQTSDVPPSTATTDAPITGEGTEPKQFAQSTYLPKATTALESQTNLDEQRLIKGSGMMTHLLHENHTPTTDHHQGTIDDHPHSTTDGTTDNQGITENRHGTTQPPHQFTTNAPLKSPRISHVLRKYKRPIPVPAFSSTNTHHSSSKQPPKNWREMPFQPDLIDPNPKPTLPTPPAATYPKPKAQKSHPSVPARQNSASQNSFSRPTSATKVGNSERKIQTLSKSLFALSEKLNSARDSGELKEGNFSLNTDIEHLLQNIESLKKQADKIRSSDREPILVTDKRPVQIKEEMLNYNITTGNLPLKLHIGDTSVTTSQSQSTTSAPNQSENTKLVSSTNQNTVNFGVGQPLQHKSKNRAQPIAGESTSPSQPITTENRKPVQPITAQNTKPAQPTTDDDFQLAKPITPPKQNPSQPTTAHNTKPVEPITIPNEKTRHPITTPETKLAPVTPASTASLTQNTPTAAPSQAVQPVQVTDGPTKSPQSSNLPAVNTNTQTSSTSSHATSGTITRWPVDVKQQQPDETTSDQDRVTTGTTPNTLYAKSTMPDCDINLGFVLDGSASIEGSQRGNFLKMINFVKDMIHAFTKLSQQVHVGTVVYSTKAEIILRFGTKGTEEMIDQILDNTTYPGQGSLTGNALKEAWNNMFVGAPRGRDNVLLLMTDGPSNDDIKKPSKWLKGSGVKLFVLGLGNGYDMSQLNTIASEPLEQHVFTKQYDELKTSVQEIRNKLCGFNSDQILQIVTNPSYQRDQLDSDKYGIFKPNQCIIDVAFLLDGSRQVETNGEGNFQRQLNFVKNAVQSLPLSPDDVHVGVGLLGNSDVMVFPINKHYTENAVDFELDRIQFPSSEVIQVQDLKDARNIMLGQGTRDVAPKVVVLVTDVSSMDSYQTGIEELRKDGNEAILFGVGSFSWKQKFYTRSAVEGLVDQALTVDDTEPADAVKQFAINLCKLSNEKRSEIPRQKWKPSQILLNKDR